MDPENEVGSSRALEDITLLHEEEEEGVLADALKNILQLTGCEKPTHNHKIYMNHSESTQQANIQHRTISSIICIRDGLPNSICGCALCSFTRTKVDYSTIH